MAVTQSSFTNKVFLKLFGLLHINVLVSCNYIDVILINNWLKLLDISVLNNVLFYFGDLYANKACHFFLEIVSNPAEGRELEIL